MTESATTAEAPQPQKRHNRIAEEKARLRAELEALVNKVPPAVNCGGVQTTRQWVAANQGAGRTARSARASRFKLRDVLASMTEWQRRGA